MVYCNLFPEAASHPPKIKRIFKFTMFLMPTTVWRQVSKNLLNCNRFFETGSILGRFFSAKFSSQVEKKVVLLAWQINCGLYKTFENVASVPFQTHFKAFSSWFRLPYISFSLWKTFFKATERVIILSNASPCRHGSVEFSLFL